MASITKREGKNGVTFKITVTEGRDCTGKQIRHYLTWKPEPGMSIKKAEREVLKVAVQFERDIDFGYHVDDKQTFREYVDYFLKLRQKRGDRPNTIHGSRRNLERACEYIGDRRLNEIRPRHINAIYDELLKPGANRQAARAFPLVNIAEEYGTGVDRTARECGVSRTVIQRIKRGDCVKKYIADRISAHYGRSDLFRIVDDDLPLNLDTIKGLHLELSAIFEQATREMLIPYNPVKKATRPKGETEQKKKHLEPDELEAVLNALESEPIRIRTLFTLYALTGCRRGEVLALKWRNVDFSRRCLTIEASLNYIPELGTFEGKTKTSNVRTIPISLELCQLLMQYKQWHDEQRHFYGDLWTDSEYIFTKQKGGALQSNTVNSMLHDFCDRHNLPRFHPHTFRHTLASLMISRGIDVLTVSKIMGHAQVSTTIDIYGHAIEDAKQAAIEEVSSIIFSKNA